MSQPARVRKEIPVYRSDPFSLLVRFVDKPTGDPIDVSASQFQAAAMSRGELIDFDIVTDDAADGVIYLTLTPEQTELLPPTAVNFDLEETPRWGRTVVAGKLRATGDVTP